MDRANYTKKDFLGGLFFSLFQFLKICWLSFVFFKTVDVTNTKDKFKPDE